MTDYVFDTEPFIAYFHDEPGASEVTERLQAIESDEASGVISHATAAEVVYKIARLETGDPNHSAPGEAAERLIYWSTERLTEFTVTSGPAPLYQSLCQPVSEVTRIRPGGLPTALARLHRPFQRR